MAQDKFLNLPPFNLPNEEPKKLNSASPLIWEDSLEPKRSNEPQMASPRNPEVGVSQPEDGIALSSAEIHDIRLLLSHFAQTIKNCRSENPQENLIAAKPVFAPVVKARPFESVAAPVVEKENLLKEHLMSQWEKLPMAVSPEQEYGETFKKILVEIPEKPYFARIFLAFCSVFPIQNFLRHQTPDQKVAGLMVLTDRFLAMLVKTPFEARHQLLKLMTRYASDMSETYSFFQNEGENFEIQHYERVEGSFPSGRVIREMNGFVVANKKTGAIFRMGKALT